MTETDKLLVRIGTARDAISRKTEQTSLDYMIDGVLMNCSVMLKEQEKEIKALRLLVKWATDCDFDIDGMVHVAKRTLEDHGAFEEGR